MTSTLRTRLLRCVPVDEAVTTLGYFHASLAVAGILVVLREIVTSLFNLVTAMQYGSGYGLIVIRDMSLLLLPLGLSATMAVCLIVGVRKRRARCVLAYFVGGALGALALAAYWLVRGSTDFYYFVYEGGVEMVLVFFAYVVCLGVVCSSYRAIKLENDRKDAYRLLQEDGSDADKKNIYSIDFKNNTYGNLYLKI